MLDELTALIGERKTWALALLLNGGKVYVPKSHKPPKAETLWGQVVATLEAEDVHKITRVYAGDFLILPLRPARRALILSLHKAGMEVPAIAQKLVMTKRTIRSIIRSAEPLESRQP